MGDFYQKLPAWLYYPLRWINNLPNRFYPGVYREGKDNDWRTREFWWRQFFHALGGHVLGLFLPFYFVAALMAIKEKLEPSHGRLKSIVDILAWTWGAFWSNVLIGLFI